MTTRMAAPLSPVPAPHPKQLRDLFVDLTGRGVELTTGFPVAPGREPAVVAVYVTDDLATGAIVAFDLALAAHAGGALGLVPLPRVEQALEEQALDRDLRDNVAEVANVLACVFNGVGDAPHLALHKLYADGERLPTDVAAMLGYVVRRLDVTIEIAGYGGGRLSVIAIG